MQTEVKTYKNGLTPLQVEKAKEVLSQVNLADICRRRDIKPQVIQNVLRDTSKSIEDLYVVLKDANEIIELRKGLLQKIA